jgi:hypothetical protein
MITQVKHHKKPQKATLATKGHKRPQTATRKATNGHKRPQKATKGHKKPQKATKGHKIFVAREFREKKKFFFVKSFIWS